MTLPSSLKARLARRPFLPLLLLYLITHLVGLTRLPIFMDEANYLDWGWRMTHSSQHFHSLYDAKQPLEMWLMGWAQSVISDPLLAGRLIALIAGALTLYGLYRVALLFFDHPVAQATSLLYTFIPIFFFFDRQALMESAVSAVSVWAFYFLTRYLDTSALRHLVFTSLVLSAGYFTKSTALIFLAAAVFILLLHFRSVFKGHFVTAINSLVLFFTLFIVLNLPLFLQPDFWATFSFATRYSLTASELLKFPFSVWLTNFTGFWEIFFIYFTPPLFFLVLWGIYRFPGSRRFLPLFLWVLLPLLQLLLVARSINFRYVVNFLPLFLLPPAVFLARRPHLLAASLLLPLAVCSLLVVSPPRLLPPALPRHPLLLHRRISLR